MCGISGFVGLKDEGLLERMLARLAHRGPDDTGTFIDGDVALGHRRLSIIDLTTGRQPISNEDGCVTIVYNGEIYNFPELRVELEAKGHLFATRSDTEVLVHLYEEYGVDCLHRLNGMFAFAMWDARARRLFIARDRLGIKPLYYAEGAGAFFFASEIKALLEADVVSREIDPRGIDRFLTFRYVPGPSTIFRGIKKLPAGHFCLVENGRASIEQYWKADFTPEQTEISLEEAAEELVAQLEDSVCKRLISDVPVGLFLSGGMDSSAILQLVGRRGHSSIHTFAVGFEGVEDERAQARAVAASCGAKHQEFTVRPEDFTLLPEIAYCLDQPYGDVIVLPAFLLAREASAFVKVVLTGEGGDEVFGGYVHQSNLWRAERLGRLLPTAGLRALAAAVPVLPVGIYDRFFEYPDSMGVVGRNRLQALLRVVGDRTESYKTFISLFTEEEKRALYTDDFRQALLEEEGEDEVWADIRQNLSRPLPDYMDNLIAQEFRFWLPDNILYKQDHLTMAHGLEGRVPFLDHRIVERVLRLPAGFKFRDGRNKRLLREVLERLVPEDIRPVRKRAFYMPLDGSYDRPFREFCFNLLAPERLKARGYFMPEAVEVLKTEADRSPLVARKQLMALAMFELWCEQVVSKKPASVA